MAFERWGQRFNFDLADLAPRPDETPEEGWTRLLKIYSTVDYQRHFNARMNPIPEPGQQSTTAAKLKHIARRTHENSKRTLKEEKEEKGRLWPIS
jgi:hypothetical protein